MKMKPEVREKDNEVTDDNVKKGKPNDNKGMKPADNVKKGESNKGMKPVEVEKIESNNNDVRDNKEMN